MFGRLITAMVTPFDSSLKLDLSRLPQLIEHLVETGTTSLVVCGTTGESPTLAHDEKIALFEECVRLCKGRIPVIAGTGSNSTQASVSLTQEADRVGVDGFLIVAPYYNKPSQEGLYRHFRAIAEATDKPVLLYNIPGRSVVNVQAETTVRLSAISNIVGVKESSGDITQISKVIAGTPEDFLVYSGDDKFALPVMALGGDGVVSVCSHVVGAQMVEMISAFLEGDLPSARGLHNRLLPVFEEMFKSPSPAPIKAALEMVGVPVGGVRLPLVDLNADEKRELRRVLGKVVQMPALH